jgi:pyruvate,water dikinase
VLDFFRKRTQKKELSEKDQKEQFAQYYQAFRDLLGSNHHVLATMADMQEKSSGVYVFDQAYIRGSCRTILEGIEKIIGRLNILSNNRYSNLVVPYQACMSRIQEIIDPKMEIPSTGYTLNLKNLTKNDSASAGGKIANLGEVSNILGVRVPPGFVITTYAYKTFMTLNGIEHFVRQQLQDLDIRDYTALREATDEIQKKILTAPIPAELEQEVMDAYESLRRETGQDDLKVALRSSAAFEDVRASFAGQYKSSLNVPANALFEEYKSIVSSQFSPRGVFYYKAREFSVDQMAMAVGVLAMVDAVAAGVAYTRDPENPDQPQVLINAVCGLGPYAVDGSVSADLCTVTTEGRDAAAIRYLQCHRQKTMLKGDPKGGIREEPVPVERMEKHCLSDDLLFRLSKDVTRIEDHFGEPQDIEWAVDQDERIFYLQSRPLRMPPRTAPIKQKPFSIEKRYKKLLDSGTVVCRGIGIGPVRVMSVEDDMGGFPEGAVLVIRHSDPEYAVLLKKASAVVAEIGTPLGHLATVIREYNVPAIFNAAGATRILENGAMVTVDALYANVYEGVVEELRESRSKLGDFTATPVVRQLREILRHVTPLNLTDPRSPGFSPVSCKTLHDITRFSHEAAMQCMFNVSKEGHFTEYSAKRLVAEIPLQYWVIDLEDGIDTEARGKTVRIDQVKSIPMRALWDGMTAFPWKGPPPIDTKGFLATMLSASRDPGIEPAVGRRFVDRNYILLAQNFCNISTRLGFHFSTLESYIGANANDNYVSFVFTGGGADDDRKNRRVRLIRKLLAHFEFRVETGADSLFARIEGYDADMVKDRIKILGYIMVHTRQMDMGMFNDKMLEWYHREMLKEMSSLIRHAG